MKVLDKFTVLDAVDVFLENVDGLFRVRFDDVDSHWFSTEKEARDAFEQAKRNAGVK